MEQFEYLLGVGLVYPIPVGRGRTEGVEYGTSGGIDVGVEVIGGQVTGQPLDGRAGELAEAADQGDLIDRIEQAVLRLVGQSVCRAALFRRVRVVLGALVVLRVDPVDQVAGQIPCLVFTDLRFLLQAQGDPGSLICLFRGEVRLPEQVLEQVLEMLKAVLVRLLLGRRDLAFDELANAQLPVLVQDRYRGGTAAQRYVRPQSVRVVQEKGRLEHARLAEHVRQEEGHDLLVRIGLTIPRAGRPVEAARLPCQSTHLGSHPEQAGGRLEAGLGGPVGLQPVLGVLGDLKVLLRGLGERDDQGRQDGDHHEDHEQGYPVLSGQHRPDPGRNRREITHELLPKRLHSLSAPARKADAARKPDAARKAASARGLPPGVVGPPPCPICCAPIRRKTTSLEKG